MTAKLAAWLCLKTAPGLRLRNAVELLARYPDPCEFVGQPTHPLYAEPGLPAGAARHLAQAVLPENQAQISKFCDHYQIQILCYSDPDYPLGLRGIIGPPLILYYRGDLPRALRNTTLGVVGTRKPTAYGRSSCQKLLRPVCAKQVTIVSGLALGIDATAHAAAVEQNCPTVAVLACGVDRIYPPVNKELAEKLVHNGALVSEYEPGAKPDAWNFPARNRLISALSQKVFIVEGALTSGALLTAKFALEQGRDILALPGEISHPNAQGPNYLIKNGALCVTCPEDILTALGLDSASDQQLEAVPDISPDEQSVYDFFKSAQREITFDELLVESGHSFGKLSTILLNLELKGCISKSTGNTFILE